MRFAPKRLLAGMVVLAVDTATFDWCSDHQAGRAGAAPTSESALFLDGERIPYSADYAKRSNLVFAAAERRAFSAVLNVTRTTTFDPERVAAVGARISGRIRHLYHLEGDTVQAGDLLADIESAEFGTAQASLPASRARADAAITNEKREHQLAELGISSKRDAELAWDVAARARAELSAGEQRVRVMAGTPAANTLGILSLRSPMGGSGRDGERVEVLSGFRPGEVVAASGVMVLRSHVFRE
jgi:membrane fusion protein, heavy metal efflux system